MIYTLMHKHILVLDMEIDEDTGFILKILDIYTPEHLPVGLFKKGQELDRSLLNKWWISRAIPASRSGLRDALEQLNVYSPQFLLTRCFGLSLSDQYWICPSKNSALWPEMNFFENDFSVDVGNALFGRELDKKNINLCSPDNTSDGWLKKKWIIADGKRMLVKAGSFPFYQEPLNEVLATAIMRRLKNVSYAPYHLIWEDELPLSVCEDFITTETELVTAWNIMQCFKQPNHISDYEHFLNCAAYFEIPNIKESLDQMITVDYLIANTDRHYNNFGGVRNAYTLEWTGAAPIFDCGTSMWHDQFTHTIRGNTGVRSKPFKNKHSEQIKIVTSFDWLDFETLKGIDEELSEILIQSPYIDDQRRDALCFGLNERVEGLREIANTL